MTKFTFAEMKIAVIAGCLSDENLKPEKEYIEDLLISLSGHNQKLIFFILTKNKTSINFQGIGNFEYVLSGTPGKTVLQNKYWWDIKLPELLKKHKADILISFDGRCSISLNIPQILFGFENTVINQSSAGKAKIIFAGSEWERNTLIKKGKIKNNEHVKILNLAIRELYQPVNESGRRKIKEKFSGGKEYFLCPDQFYDQESFIKLLKSFSLFKKRQQSHMKLMLFSGPGKKSSDSLVSYKYRNDVLIVDNPDSDDVPLLIGSSYAVIIPGKSGQSVFYALKSMKTGIPVLSTVNSPIREYAGDAAMYFDENTEKEIAGKMIRIYTDEGLRNQLIKKGMEEVKKFTIEKSADQLWDCIQKVVS